MIKPLSYSAKLALGSYKLPANVTVIGSRAVEDTKTGANGVLIRHNATGWYSVYSCGARRSVDPLEAKRYENGLAKLL